jgi:hypothetical protein
MTCVYRGKKGFIFEAAGYLRILFLNSFKLKI